MNRITLCVAVVLSVSFIGCKGGSDSSRTHERQSVVENSQGQSSEPNQGVSERNRIEPTVKYENSNLATGYVGSQRCIECHATQAAAFSQDPHSTSCGTQPIEECTAGSVEHEPSRRMYEVIAGREMQTQTEYVRLDSATRVEVNSFDVATVVGSGTHGHTMLVESDGFLFQSPVTWYTENAKWGMSPGYADEDQPGFGRLVDARCLRCHVGRVEFSSDNPFRDIRIPEPAISCERCHGPGELHVNRWQQSPAAELEAASAAIDTTIVNPRKLPRDLADAICADCHLQGDYTVPHAGFDELSFRPGQLIEQTRMHYRTGYGNAQLEIVGHVEQLRSSPCFQNSETLSCLSCHNPHHDLDGKGTEAIKTARRSTVFEASFKACIQCHEPNDCGEVVAGHWDNTAETCVSCHMPRGTTKIPHLALTNHRVGLHTSSVNQVAVGETNDRPGLIALTSEAACSEGQSVHAKIIALAQSLESSEREPVEIDDTFERQIIDLRDTAVSSPGSVDNDLAAALAVFASKHSQLDSAVRLATGIINDESGATPARVTALKILRDFAKLRRNSELAIRVYTELVAARPNATDSFELGRLLATSGGTGSLATAIQMFELSVRFAPAHEQTHRILAELYAQSGDDESAQRHRVIADALVPGTEPAGPSNKAKEDSSF